MSVLLSTTTQHQIEDELVKEGLLSGEKLDLYRARAGKENQPLFSLLIKDNAITDEQFTRASAMVNKIPYVNLTEAPPISQKVLELLSQDTANYYMAVPLGNMADKLVVAMLDAANVQAVDFLSKKIGRPLKVYAASESGIRRMLKQYERSIEKGVSTMLAGVAEAAESDLAEQAAELRGEAQPKSDKKV